mmetsp:Transcript_22593/g.55718  ORF Transcript_22593/g.55718 Transcript_22593/m.55718 type:complete len:211 (-) Transcript_22593:177-809(-)
MLQRSNNLLPHFHQILQLRHVVCNAHIRHRVAQKIVKIFSQCPARAEDGGETVNVDAVVLRHPARHKCETLLRKPVELLVNEPHGRAEGHITRDHTPIKPHVLLSNITKRELSPRVSGGWVWGCGIEGKEIDGLKGSHDGQLEPHLEQPHDGRGVEAGMTQELFVLNAPRIEDPIEMRHLATGELAGEARDGLAGGEVEVPVRPGDCEEG